MAAMAPLVAGLLAAATVSASAETIKIGLLKTTGSAPIFIAEEKGYFKAENLDAENVYFDAGQPTAMAVVAGSTDFGVAGLGAGLYALAGQGALTLIAAQAREVPGFPNGTYMVSSRAGAAGLKSFTDIPGHSVAMTAMGSPFHYGLALLAEKYHFDLATVRLMPLQSIANNISAVVGGSADIGMAPAAQALPVVAKGEVKVLGYVGDETPWQLAAVFTATKTANDRRDLVERFLRAYRRGARDAHDAFTDAAEHRRDMAAAPEILAILSRVIGQPPALLDAGVQYIDREARLDVKDVAHQLAWYKTQGLLKDAVPVERVIDRRYAVPLPGQ
jgi:NitT/TauT family transport system substrate-binding protein